MKTMIRLTFVLVIQMLFDNASVAQTQQDYLNGFKNGLQEVCGSDDLPRIEQRENQTPHKIELMDGRLEAFKGHPVKKVDSPLPVEGYLTHDEDPVDLLKPCKDTIKGKPLKKYSVLLAEPTRDHDFPTSADSIGTFYVDDINTIAALIQEWGSTVPKQVGYREKYRFTYHISLVNEGKGEIFCAINLPSEFIYINDEYRDFNEVLFNKYRYLFRPVTIMDSTFQSIVEARKYLKKAKRKTDVITYAANWESFDGEFQYTLPLFDNPPSSEELIHQLTEEFTQRFPKESFHIDNHSHLSNGHVFTIYGNERLVNELKEGASNWKPFVPELLLWLKSE